MATNAASNAQGDKVSNSPYALEKHHASRSTTKRPAGSL